MTENVIRTEDVLKCPLCGDENRKVLYAGLRDRLFGAPGEWNLKECCRCGLVFLDPRPTPEDVGKAYVTYCTHSSPDAPKKCSLVRRIYQLMKNSYLGRRWGYSDGLKRWQMPLSYLLYLFPKRRVELDYSVMYLSSIRGGHLVDIGCGSGELIERFGLLGWKAEGVDTDELAIRVAHERGLEAHVGTLESRKYQDDSIDAVTISHVIEHVHDPLKLLRECYRVLKPHGQLVIATPNGESWGHKRCGPNWVGLDPPRHLYILSPSLLCRLLRKAGFQTFRVTTTMRLANALFVASLAIHRTGIYTMGSPQPPIVHVWARGMQFVEWAILRINPFAGQEIIVIARKQNDENA